MSKRLTVAVDVSLGTQQIQINTGSRNDGLKASITLTSSGLNGTCDFYFSGASNTTPSTAARKVFLSQPIALNVSPNDTATESGEFLEDWLVLDVVPGTATLGTTTVHITFK